MHPIKYVLFFKRRLRERHLNLSDT